MRLVFLNGPVQNAIFSFESRPGKAVGIRIAAALNAIIDVAPAPHLWNTVTLDGDLRHRHLQRTEQISRADWEASLISAKYASHPTPPAGAVTDADAEVERLAYEMVESQLRTGRLRIERVAVQQCRNCSHMTGFGSHGCKACGRHETRRVFALHLIADQAAGRPLDRSDIHSSHRRQPLHLQSTASNVAPRLILSRTRDHGIELSPFGLPGLVLDPRAGLHVTVLAVARRLEAENAVMTTTENAANHIAAYGMHFRQHDDTRLQYALHGHAPYSELATVMAGTYEAYDASPVTRSAFETWFIPLVTLKEKSAVRAEQLPGLFKYFARSRSNAPAAPHEALVHAVRKAVFDGDPSWIMNKAMLAAAMAGGLEAVQSKKE